MQRTIYTVGHSNRSVEALVEILAGAGVGALADIRRVPFSRRHPQFGQKQLAAALAAHGVTYAWLEELGGRREPSAEAPHLALDPPLAGYAEHTRTAEFARGIERLADLHETADTVVMCAEANPHECHRLVLADWLVTHGWRVEHLVADGRRGHILHPHLRVAQGELVYDWNVQRPLL